MELKDIDIIDIIYFNNYYGDITRVGICGRELRELCGRKEWQIILLNIEIV